MAACCAVASSAGAAAPGAVWVPSLQATQGFDKLSAFPNGVAYAQYADSYARSTDFGVTWRLMPRPPHTVAGGAGIRFATPEIGYALGGSGSDATRTVEELAKCGALTALYRTADAGSTWSPVCMPPGRRLLPVGGPAFTPAPSPLAVWRDGRTLALAGTEQTGAACDPGVVYTSGDAGARWTRAVLPGRYFPSYRIVFHDARTIGLIAYERPAGACDGVSDRNAVFVSRDGGRTFARVLDCHTQPLCTAVGFASASRLVVGRTDGSTLVSRDGGRTWSRGQRLANPANDQVVASGVAQPWQFWVQSFGFADAAHGFASTRGGGTWRTVDGGISWTQERSHECAYYPFGVGEIAVASPDHAVTGGPLAISARVPVADAPGGCATSTGNAMRTAEFVVPGLRADGAVILRSVPGTATATRSR